MKRVILAVMALFVSAFAVFADDDPIAARRALMKANGAATKTMVGMLKGAPYDQTAVMTALKSYANAAANAPGLFPDASKLGDTNALPAIWDNKPDFEARFKKLGDDVTAAEAAITDEASFKATMPGVLKNCGGCHEKYRAKQS